MRWKRDNLIVLGIVVVLTATYMLVVYRSQSGSLTAIKAESAQTQRRLEADAVKALPLPHMAREIAALRKRYEKDWRRRLPRRQELAGFLREISTNLSEAKLANQIIQPGVPTRGLLYHCLPITMKFEGGFLALAGFLRRVDGMTRLTRIDQLAINPAGGGKELTIELGMNIYFTEH